ncbi:aldehyde dehydrogenase family protein [Streptomyces sp. 891-h]|uniref:aldehyde dehydrogenase family protein n=1 Tax=unclassified Streptomyces TaxID=2593676 RepID=UPI001FA98C68|nr:aldehyde dehydrogenase family protein [Streptomyces sp. 891-h]UNZ19904.1 aldehyde dehydrogenase family protein [Streptomyces sp. 891-h]
MTQPSMPVLESLTRTWPDIEAAHESAAGAGAALLRSRTELLGALTRLATYASARDELLRSLRTLAGAPWELARTGVPQLARVSVVLPQHTALYSYVRHCLVPALYCDEVVVRPAPRIRETAYELHHVISRGLAPRLAARIRFTDAAQRDFAPMCAESDAVAFTGSAEAGTGLMTEIGDGPLFLLSGPAPNPLIVGPRAEPAAACRAVLRARLHNSGQDRLCPDVLFVHRLRLNALVEQLRAELSVLTVGARGWPDAVLTALTYGEAVQGAARFLSAHADRVVAGGGTDLERMQVEPSLLVFDEDPGFHPPPLAGPLFCVVPYEDPELLREWARDPLEVERGMYAAVFGEPRLSGRTLGTAVVLRDDTPFDVEDGNQPCGGYGALASGVRREGVLLGRPQLLSREAAQRYSVITGPLR